VWEVAVLALELIVVLGAVILGCSVLARRYRIAPSVLLLACGVLLERRQRWLGA